MTDVAARSDLEKRSNNCVDSAQITLKECEDRCRLSLECLHRLEVWCRKLPPKTDNLAHYVHTSLGDKEDEICNLLENILKQESALKRAFNAFGLSSDYDESPFEITSHFQDAALSVFTIVLSRISCTPSRTLALLEAIVYDTAEAAQKFAMSVDDCFLQEPALVETKTKQIEEEDQVREEREKRKRKKN
jgi:hypothetical protein